MWTGKSKHAVWAAAIAVMATRSVLASTWKGNTANWDDETEWTAGIPGISATVAVVPAGSSNLVNDRSIDDFDLTGGVVRSANGSELIVGNQFRFFGGSIDGNLRLNVTGSALLGSGAAVLSNAGSLTFANSPSSNASMTFNNSGTVRLGAVGSNASVTMRLLNGSTTDGTYTGANSSLIFGYTEGSPQNLTHYLTKNAVISTGSFTVTDQTTLKLDAGAKISATNVLITGDASVTGNGNFTTAAHLNSATVLPGDEIGQIGTLHFGSNLTLDGSPAYYADLSDNAGAPSSDLLEVAGPMSIQNLQLFAVVPAGSSFTPNERFTIIRSAGGFETNPTSVPRFDPSSFNAQGFIEGLGPMNHTYEFAVETGLHDIDLVYIGETPTPEPGLLLASTLSAGAIGVMRRRRCAA